MDAESRLPILDEIRGLALFGVLMVNLWGDFRTSLFRVIQQFHTDPAWWNRWVDMAVAGLLEFKAISLFSILFGVGMAIQAEKPGFPFLRRFLVLFLVGAVHMLILWNGDILMLYAVCAVIVLPALRMGPRGLLIAGAGFIALPYIVPLPVSFPSGALIQADAVEALRTYAQGGYGEIFRFRWRETTGLILPLLEMTLPRTVGLMLCGAAFWKLGVFQKPGNWTRQLTVTAWLGGAVGLSITGVNVWARSTGGETGLPGVVNDLGSSLPLALAYGAGMLRLLATPAGWIRAGLGALGRMALSNYLMQSVIFGVIFYGYGFGLFGRLEAAAAFLLGLAVYAAQAIFSVWWLQRFRFGPFEWVWRSLTYGRWHRLSVVLIKN